VGYFLLYQINAEFDILWSAWKDAGVAYHTGTGVTHHVSAFGIALLDIIEINSPCDINKISKDMVAVIAGANDREDINQPIQQAITKFLSSGFIEVVDEN
jgi:PqqD family protein of HPr-rel-A system